MATDGGAPLWLLAELTYACPLQCPYCSNPLDMAKSGRELSTQEWKTVMRDARAMGALQLGFSGGEPLLRRDLEELVSEARELGYYTNLITSGVGMDEARVAALREAGLDHIQISFQASDAALNDFIAGTAAFEHKRAMARAVKDCGYPMVLNVVLHRYNIDAIGEILDMTVDLQADYVELANTQYYGWAWHNRDRLLPTRAQLQHAQTVAEDYRERFAERMKIYYIVPDYYGNRPKPCMNGWGRVFLTVTPDGTALPCQAARQLPGLSFPNVRDQSVRAIWEDSDAFNRYRGYAWMKSPCRDCPERERDFGGCRCQAYLITGDAANADPVCDKSPDHARVLESVAKAQSPPGNVREVELVFRNPKNSRALCP